MFCFLTFLYHQWSIYIYHKINNYLNEILKKKNIHLLTYALFEPAILWKSSSDSTATTAVTSGIQCINILSIPFFNVTVELGHPVHEPCNCIKTTSSMNPLYVISPPSSWTDGLILVSISSLIAATTSLSSGRISVSLPLDPVPSFKIGSPDDIYSFNSDWMIGFKIFQLIDSSLLIDIKSYPK